jgi:PAS domain S-box-containing protein
VVAPLRSGVQGLPSLSGQSSRNGDAAHTSTPEAAPGQDQELPAVGVILLSREREPITDEDIEWLMPFANQAGVALAKASDVELLRSSGEQHAIENEWLWAMVHAVDDPVVVTDVANNIILQNRRAESIFRTGPEDSEGKQHAIWMNNFLFTAALSTWNLEQGSVRTSRELTLVDPIDGNELTFDALSQPVTHYRLGGQRGTVTVLRNVTDLRQANEQLSQNVQELQSRDEEIRLERDRLDLILASVPNPILVLDNENQPVKMNREALRLFQPATTARGATDAERKASIALTNETNFTSFLAQLRLEKSRVKSGELALVDPDTEDALAMWVTATEIHDAVGAISAVVAVMQNLAPLRELERVRVEQALFESEKLAATGRLAASIAHEINNPLEVIKNSLYLLVNKIPASDPNHKFLTLAKTETERMSRILRDTLGMYRPAASMAPTDINAMIEDAESLVGKLLRQKGVRIENDLHPLPPANASPDQLKQVILNLLLNAQQAMPDGGTVYVGTRRSQDADPDLLGGEAIHITVRDTGDGIAEEHLPHIFEPFFTTKRDGQKGTGLGLWVSYTIVRDHGGTIRVRSRPGQGTTFTISLPTGGAAAHAAG